MNALAIAGQLIRHFVLLIKCPLGAFNFTTICNLCTACLKSLKNSKYIYRNLFPNQYKAQFNFRNFTNKV